MTIWKYELEITDSQVIEIPYNYKILSVGVQNKDTAAECICMWVIVCPENDKVDVPIEIRGTGQSDKHFHVERIDDFIGTVQIRNALVFHVFKGC